MNSLISFIVVTLVVLSSAFGLYKLIGSGGFIDWLVGSLSIVWMFFVVTIPWNSFFKAREIVYEAEVSRLKNITIQEDGLSFAQKVAKRSLFISISLHIASALTLFWISYSQISMVGYYSSILILLLTFLRPGIRFYEYLHKKLEMIRQEFHYPREDVDLLKQKVEEASYLLDTNPESNSWKIEVDKHLEGISKQLEKIDKQIIQLSHSIKENKITSEKELSSQIESIRKENKDYISKIVEHGEVVESISVLAKYLKKI